MHEEKLKLILNQLNHDSSDVGIEASEMVAMEGLSMAVWSPDDANKDRVGPMCAGVFAFGKGIAKEFDMGELGQVIVKGSKGSALINFACDQTILTLKVKPNGQIGQASEFARHAEEEIRQMLM